MNKLNIKFLILFSSLIGINRSGYSQEITLDEPVLITSKGGTLKAAPCLDIPFTIDSLKVNTDFYVASGFDTIVICDYQLGEFHPVRGKGVPCDIAFDQNVKIKYSYPNIEGMVWYFENDRIIFQIGNTLYMPRKGSTISFTSSGVKMSGVRTSGVNESVSSPSSSKISYSSGQISQSDKQEINIIENNSGPVLSVKGVKGVSLHETSLPRSPALEHKTTQNSRTHEAVGNIVPLKIKLIKTEAGNDYSTFRIWDNQNWQYENSEANITIYSANGISCQVVKAYSMGEFGFFPVEGAGEYSATIKLTLLDQMNNRITKSIEKTISITENPANFLGVVNRKTGNFLYTNILSGIQYVPGKKIKVLSKATNYKVVMATGYITYVNQQTCTIELQEIYGVVQRGDIVKL
jgi:hypothetical protein